MFVKIGVLKNLAIFTGKHLRWSLFLRKLQAFRRLAGQLMCFSVNIEKFLRALILKNIYEKAALKNLVKVTMTSYF